jgi:hypothetical protein
MEGWCKFRVVGDNGVGGERERDGSKYVYVWSRVGVSNDVCVREGETVGEYGRGMSKYERVGGVV